MSLFGGKTITSDTFVLGTNGASYNLMAGTGMEFAQAHNDSVTVFANNAQISAMGNTALTIDDCGHGLALNIRGWANNLTVWDFGHDATGSIMLAGQPYLNGPQAYASLRGDGHGGTLLPIAGGSIDFRGVAMGTLRPDQFLCMHT